MGKQEDRQDEVPRMELWLEIPVSSLLIGDFTVSVPNAPQ